MLLVLRDARLLRYDESILGIVETDLCYGPIHFDCYPNFSVSLKDKNILKILTLQIKTHNYEIASGSIPLSLVYIIHYKAMMSSFGSKAFKYSTKEQTLLLQTDISKTNSIVPKPIQWNEVSLPEQCDLEDSNPPIQIKNTNPFQIT